MMMAKVTKTKWSPWARSIHDRPIPQDGPIVAMAAPGRPALSAADAAAAATGISYQADAWRVVGNEWRSRRIDAIEHRDVRTVTVGWVVRITRLSRWEGEGVDASWMFVSGAAAPDLHRHLDMRWGDATDTASDGDTTPIGAIVSITD